MALPFHRKYRPKDFSKVYGNKNVIKTLQTKVEEGITTTYLLTGPRGTGKTTCGRIIAKELGCNLKIDFYELDLGDVGLKDKARKIKENLQFVSFSGGPKVYLLDECQEASAGFWQSMLKTLEEPPHNTFFILCTTDPQKLPITIKSRCSQFIFKQLTSKEMIKFLLNICKKENIDFDQKILKEISNKTDGIPREALILLDQIKGLQEDDDVYEAIANYVPNADDNVEVKELIYALMNGNSWKKISVILSRLDIEPESARYAVIGYLSKVLLNSDGSKADKIFMILEEFKESFMYSKMAGLYCACYACSKM